MSEDVLSLPRAEDLQLSRSRSDLSREQRPACTGETDVLRHENIARLGQELDGSRRCRALHGFNGLSDEAAVATQGPYLRAGSKPTSGVRAGGGQNPGLSRDTEERHQ